MSVNDCWQGRRFKTPSYKQYEALMLSALPKQIKIDKGEKLCIDIEVGYSNKASDIDNFLKPFLDILQKKYGFNDKDIYELHIYKNIVPKGTEYIEFDVTYQE